MELTSQNGVKGDKWMCCNQLSTGKELWNFVVCDFFMQVKSCGLSSTAIFNLFHLMAHINYLLKFCGTPEVFYIFCQSGKINRYNFDSFTLDDYSIVLFCFVLNIFY